MINIRKAKSTEWASLQELNNEVFIDNAQYDPDIIPDWAFSEQGQKYFQELVNDPKSVCFVAVNETGKLVGYIAGGPKEFSYRKSKYAELDNMGVMPAFRSHGIGQQLITHFLKWTKAEGYQKVFVSSYFKNEQAVRFYEKSGFETIDVGLEREV